jgi:mono/diheme cytochrome c family protein
MLKPLGSCAAWVVAVLVVSGCPADRPDDPAVQQPASPATAPPALDPAMIGELPPGTTTEMVAAGQQLYGTVCVACHGPAGVGTPLGPALNDQDWIHIGGEIGEIIEITRDGVLQPQEYPAPMPRMGGASFSEEQLQSIGAYVYALSRGLL